jgi:hypothetical protein
MKLRRFFTSWQSGSRESGKDWRLDITFKSTSPIDLLPPARHHFLIAH